MKLYVTNLSNRVTDADLKAAFLDFGTVRSANVVFDRDSGRSRGFGFVDIDGLTGIESLQGIELDGNQLTVMPATND